MVPTSFRVKAFFTLAWPVAFALAFWFPPISQDLDFFDFAESGQISIVPHAWNVLSNIAFICVGLVGLKRLASIWEEVQPWAEAVFYIGITLTGLGSAYFHWNPNMDTLLWDRLPMTVSFMAFYCAMFQRCLRCIIPTYSLVLALGVGAWSVLHWTITESAGVGDLRFYGVVQFLPMLLLPILFVGWPPQRVKFLWGMLGFYAIAKICEYFDHEIAAWMPLALTGHTWKHLFAAVGTACFLLAPPKETQP